MSSSVLCVIFSSCILCKLLEWLELSKQWFSEFLFKISLVWHVKRDCVGVQVMQYWSTCILSQSYVINTFMKISKNLKRGRGKSKFFNNINKQWATCRIWVIQFVDGCFTKKRKNNNNNNNQTNKQKTKTKTKKQNKTKQNKTKKKKAKQKETDISQNGKICCLHFLMFWWCSSVSEMWDGVLKLQK